MSFGVTADLSPPFQQIQVIRQHYSAKDLGKPLYLKKNLDSFFDKKQKKVQLNYQFVFNLKNADKSNYLKIINFKENEKFLEQFGSVSSIIKAGSFRSKIELDYSKVKSELTLVSENGLGIRLTGEAERTSDDIDVIFEPIFRFRKSFNLVPKPPKTAPKTRQDNLQQEVKFSALGLSTAHSLQLHSPETLQRNEMNDFSDDLQTLKKSLNLLANRQVGKTHLLSFDVNLQKLSAEFKLPVSGDLIDELELQIKTNLPKILVNGQAINNSIKSTLSLKYSIAINATTKFEIKSAYDLPKKNQKILFLFNHQY